jgi:uncharacterized protein (DUF169 family)
MIDLSVFKKFNFERPPVGIKYLLNKPKGIKKLEGKTLALCEMLPEAQKGTPFYVTQEDFECVGPLVLGMEEPNPVFESGQLGGPLGLFKEARANRRQAEIILRAHSYTSGQTWKAQGSTVIGCAWLFIEPYLSGELNFTVTNLNSGWNSRQVLPKGLIVITIPYDLLPMIVANLEEMEWVPSDYLEGRDAHNQRFQEVAEAAIKDYNAAG